MGACPAMADITFVIANKNYSSWSLRGWLAMKLSGLDFDEIVIPLRQADSRTEILKYSPSAKLPALIDGAVTVWESMGIIEYLAEKCPDAGLWPKAPAERAWARAVASEMHGGFIPLRRALPMNMRRQIPGIELNDLVQGDINRIQAIWREAQRSHANACGEGPYLLGEFSALDAMFAPIVSRFTTHEIPLEEGAIAYMDAVNAHPLMVEWCEAAKCEPWVIQEFEIDPTSGE